MTDDASVIILAAGDGTRLRGMTTAPDGTFVPKQFCSFGTGRTLMASTIARARRLVPADRIVAIVAEGHRRWWDVELAGLDRDAVVVQPRNRGTAPGLLLPLLHVFGRDPSAIVVVMPSDHEVASEPVFESAVNDAIDLAREDAARVFLLGITPDGPETEYGWIVPSSRSCGSARRVAAFVEKPDRDRAIELMEDGATWSSFVMVGRAGAFLNLYRIATPELLGAFLSMAQDSASIMSGEPPQPLRDLHAMLPAMDFSRDVLQSESVRPSLGLVPVPACGWSDLGTPARVSKWLSARASVAAATA